MPPDDRVNVFLGLGGAIPENFVGGIEHREQPALERRQFDLLLRRGDFLLRHRHEPQMRDAAHPARAGVRHRRGRLQKMDLFPGEVGRLPIGLGRASGGAARRLQEFRKPLAGKFALQEGRAPVVDVVAVQADVDAIPARRLRIDDQFRHAIRHEAIHRDDIPKPVRGCLIARLAGHQDGAVHRAPILGVPIEPPFARGRPVGRLAGRRQAFGGNHDGFTLRQRGRRQEGREDEQRWEPGSEMGEEQGGVHARGEMGT